MDRITKQIADFQRTTFDNMFYAVSMIQDQTEKTMNAVMETGLWPIPEEGKRAVSEFVQAFKKGRDEFKRIMDDSFEKMQSSFSEERETEEAGSQSQEKRKTHKAQ